MVWLSRKLDSEDNVVITDIISADNSDFSLLNMYYVLDIIRVFFMHYYFIT